MSRKITNKPVEGKPATKNDLKAEQQKRKVYNNKHKTAPSTLTVRDGGAANEKGNPINNAFFNKAMGGNVSASDLTPSSTGFASDGGSAGVGAAGGDAGGACGESLFKKNDVNVNMSEDEAYLDYLKYELEDAQRRINDKKLSNMVRAIYERRIRELPEKIKELEKELSQSEAPKDESLNEADSEGQSAKEQLKNILDAIPENDGSTWKEVSKTTIDQISNQDANNIVDYLRTNCQDVKLGDKVDSILRDLSDGNLLDKAKNINMSTIKSLFEFLTGEAFIKNHPDKVKPLVTSILAVIAVIEPTVIGEIITAVVLALPEDVLNKILTALMNLSPIKMIINKLASKENTNESINENVEPEEDLFFRAFITNLGKYNEGELEGNWVDFPIDKDDFEKELKNIGIGDVDEFGSPYEEWFITDYDTNTGINLGEYASYEELNNIGEVISDINSNHNQKAFVNALEACSGEPEDIAQAVNDGDIMFMDGVNTEEDLGYAIIDSIGSLKDALGDRITNYIDEKQMRREYEDDIRQMMYDGAPYQISQEKGISEDDVSEDDIEEWIDDNFDSYMESIIADDLNAAERGEVDLSNYFDYEAFGRDCTCDGIYTFTHDGCIEDLR